MATDGSTGADRAIDQAAGIARMTGATLLILTAGGTITGTELRRLAATGADLSETLRSSADKILERARKRATAAGIPAPKIQSSWGDAAEAILQTATRKKVDLIVVGRRGQGRLSRLLLGSVSQKVASLAPCMVLVVP